MAVKDGETSNRAKVWAVVLELAAENRHFTRVRVRDLSGLKFSIIDDHFNRFLEEEKIRRLGNGIYEMVRQFEPDRAVTVTTLEDSRVKVEIGDVVLAINPTEARKLGQHLAGWAMRLAEEDWKRDFIALMSRLDAKVSRHEKRLDNVER